MAATTTAVTYSMVTAPCPPVAIAGATAFGTTCDDCVTGQIPIPFPFNFYGNVYNSCVIQSNGIVGFGAFTYTGFSSFAIPSGGNPNNYIAGLFADIDIRYGGTITYATTGTAPNRRFVVSYDNVVPYNSGTSAGTGTASFQIILNENGSFNTVISQYSANWYATTSGALATQGAEDITGTYAFVVPGRNSTDWPGIGPGATDCTTFNPSPCVFVNWKIGAAIVSTSANYTVNPTVNTTYTATWNCGGNICTDNVLVSINGPTISQNSVTNSTDCTTPNGAISLGFSGLTPGTYTLNYLNDGVPASTSVTVGASSNVSQSTVFNSGSFTSSSPTFNRPSTYDCPNGFGTSVYYHSMPFTVSSTGVYTFNNTFSGDGYGHIYSTSFSPTAPCNNLLISDDDGNGGADPRLSTTLTAGVTYYLVTTTFSNLTTGNYSWTYTGPGGATINAVVPATANLTGLAAGTFTNFTIGSGCNLATLAGPISISSPASLVTVGTTICQGGSGTISSTTSCGTAGTTINQSAVFNSGSLASTDPTYVRSSGGTSYSASTTVYHDVASFTVSTTGSYTFNMCTPGTNFDGHASIYQTSFSASSPATNFLSADDDSNVTGNCENDSRITVTLTAGVTYYIVTGSFSTATTGNYEWTYTGPGGATISFGGTGSTLQWYTAPAGGSSISSSNPFNPVGVAGSGLVNTNTVAQTTYYAACSSNPLCRTATIFDINVASVAPTSISGTGSICVGNASTLSVVGGSLAPGAVWEWFTGSCGGTSAGFGTSINVTPTSTTTYYVRASAVGGCPATSCVSGTITLPTQGTTLTTNGEFATCAVNVNNYIHFYHSSGRFLGSINSLGQNLGNVTVTSYLSAPVNITACAGSSWQSYAMGRRWVFTPQFQPSSDVIVLLPFDQTEYTSLQTSAAGNTNALDNTVSIADLKLTKYSGPANVDNVFTNNCNASGGTGDFSIHTQTASGNVSTVIPGFGATGRYVRYQIGSFSEMWLHAASSNSPLAIELSKFSGKCENSNVTLNWETVSENNSKKFIIEKFRNDSDWVIIGELESKGNSTEVNKYIFVDENVNSGDNFYRIIEEDFNGLQTAYNSINVTCNDIINNLSIYPNPNNGEFVVEINSKNELSNSVLQITDLTGKVIFEENINISSGVTNLPINLKEVAIGSYTINIINSNVKFKPVNLIKN